jgi:hypothetical protein
MRETSLFLAFLNFSRGLFGAFWSRCTCATMKPRPERFPDAVDLAGLRIDIDRGRHLGMNVALHGPGRDGEPVKSAGSESYRTVVAVDHRATSRLPWNGMGGRDRRRFLKRIAPDQPN